jgi:medium-chain acyl-[acyl-carrier-protein] hydrolase
MAARNGQTEWILGPPASASAEVRVFCFAHVGGGASIFSGWRRFAPERIAICPVQLPGHENRLLESPYRRLDALVRMLAGILPLDKPFLFYGHSMGALVSFELARELRRRRRPGPCQIFAAACHAPARMKIPDPPRHSLPDARFVRELRRLGGTSEEILKANDVVEQILPVLRADFEMVETYAYTPEEPLYCPITAFGGDTDEDVGPDDLQSWAMETGNLFSMRTFAGGHFFLHDHAPAIVQEIAGAVDALSSCAANQLSFTGRSSAGASRSMNQEQGTP